MDQRGLRSQRYWPAVAERPLTAVAVIGADIAVDVESALVVRSVGARAVHEIGAPQRQVAGLEGEVDRLGLGKADCGQRGLGHCSAQGLPRAVHAEVAAQV